MLRAGAVDTGRCALMPASAGELKVKRTRFQVRSSHLELPAVKTIYSTTQNRLESGAERSQIILRKNIPLARLSTFRIGGHATIFCQVATPRELITAIGWARQMDVPYKIVAAGSNAVFPDTRLNALLIRVAGGKFRAGPRRASHCRK
jgi:hypothetical protein